MKRAIARLLDAAFNLYAPVVHARTLDVFTTDMVGASRLADAEADIDAWEPLEPWQRELLDASYMTDYEWAARQRHLRVVHDQPDDPGAIPGFVGSQLPAGAGAAMTPPSMPRPAQPAPAGSPNEADLALTVATVLRECGHKWPVTTAGMVARELLHHYTFQPK